MKTYFLTFAAFISISALPVASSAQITIPKIFSKNASSGISQEDAGKGVKEALTQGVTNAVLNLNKTDGFLAMKCINFFYLLML